MRVAVCTDRASWNGFIAAAGGSLLQSWQWGEFKRRQGWHVLRLAALDGREPRAAMQVLARVVPLAGAFFYAPEGPVLAPEDWAAGAPPLGALLAEAQRRGRSCGALTLRLDPLTGVPAAGAALAAHGLCRSPENVQPAATAVVDLDKSEDELLARLEKGARYLVRHAQRKGTVVRVGTADDVPLLAQMLAETGHRKGFGVRNEAYLRELAAMACAERSGELLVADMDGTTAASMLTGSFGPRSAALYAAGSELGRKVGAQYLLHWTAMVRAKRQGYQVYDFRGIGSEGDPADHWAGMTFFKQRFGTRREDLPGAWDDVYRPVAYRAFLAAQQARRELPTRLHRLRDRGDDRVPTAPRTTD